MDTQRRTVRRLPAEVHYTDDVCVVLTDVDSSFDRGYFDLYQRYPRADGLRDISICQSATATDAEFLADRIRQGQLSYASIGWLIFITTFVRAAQKKGMTPRAYADYTYDLCDKVNREVGYRAAWIDASGEIGNSVNWPEGKVYTKQDALQYFRGYMRDGRTHTEHWGKWVAPEVMNYFTYALTRAKSLRDLPVHYTDGTLFALHEGFRLGFPLVIYEGFCGTRNAPQVGTAFVRGGAKMFDAFWGLDYSPWDYGANGNETRVSGVGTWTEGHPEEFYFQTWLAAYMSGCNTLLHECGHCYHVAYPADDLVVPSDHGHKAMQFYAITRGPLADRGRPVVPFAVMLEEAHGYRGDMVRTKDENGKSSGMTDAVLNTPSDRLGIWQGRTGTATRGDWAVHRLISALWPQSRNAWTTEYAPAWPDQSVASLPWTDIDALLPRERLGEVDYRDYTCFAHDSRWADCVDVVTETIDSAVLAKFYRVLWLAGDVVAGGQLWARIEQYLDAGGTVVAAPEHLGPDARIALDLQLAGESLPLYENSGHDISGNQWLVSENLPLFAVEHLPAGAHVWAEGHRWKRPLVLEIPRGKGRLYLMLISHAMPVDAGRLSGVGTTLMDMLYDRHVGVRRQGARCQMLVNERKDDTVVTLLNHAGNAWCGEIDVRREGRPPIAEVREMLVDEAYPASLTQFAAESVRVKVRIPSHGTRVLNFGPQRAKAPRLHDGYVSISAEDQAAVQDLIRQGPEAQIGLSKP